MSGLFFVELEEVDYLNLFQDSDLWAFTATVVNLQSNQQNAGLRIETNLLSEALPSEMQESQYLNTNFLEKLLVSAI